MATKKSKRPAKSKRTTTPRRYSCAPASGTTSKAYRTPSVGRKRIAGPTAKGRACVVKAHTRRPGGNIRRYTRSQARLSK
ncbi:MAG: hypothetical protein F4X54_04115 [Chloroflexi bacterium]|nr:hypothetical protein [Chloroflexota bacterium]